MRDDVVKYWLQYAMGLVAAALAMGYWQLAKRLKTANAENAALKLGMRALLRDRIIQGYTHAASAGYWPILERESMLDMFAQYKALGGNGMICGLMQDMQELPTEQQKKVRTRA